MVNNEKINFLCIIDSFPPAGMQSGIRILELSKRLVEKNIIPIILTQTITIHSNLNYSLIKEIPSSLNIYRNLFPESKNRYVLFIRNFLFRFYFYLKWMPFLFLRVKKILRKNEDIKFIYASGPSFFTHIIGYLLKLKFKLPLVVEYRDPWSFNPYIDVNSHSIEKKIDLKIETKILKSSDILITISSALKKLLKKKFPFIKNKPIFSIPHGMNLSTHDLQYKKKPQELIFTFTGTLYEKRSINPLLRIISKLKNEDFFRNLKFILKIYGNYPKKNLEIIVEELNIKDLIFMGDLIPRAKAIQEIYRSDLAIHIGENLNYPTIAFKVWDYLSCKKKILYLGREDSYTAQFLKKNEFGITIPLENLNKGKIILKNLLNDIINNNINTNIEDNLINKFTWDNRANKFIIKVVNKFMK